MFNFPSYGLFVPERDMFAHFFFPLRFKVPCSQFKLHHLFHCSGRKKMFKSSQAELHDDDDDIYISREEMIIQL